MFLAGADLKKEYTGASLAMDLPKGNKLRLDLNTCRVNISNLMDSLREMDVEQEDSQTIGQSLSQAKTLVRGFCKEHVANKVFRKQNSQIVVLHFFQPPCPFRSLPDHGLQDAESSSQSSSP